jgi:hypothetical protein
MHTTTLFSSSRNGTLSTQSCKKMVGSHSSRRKEQNQKAKDAVLLPSRWLKSTFSRNNGSESAARERKRGKKARHRRKATDDRSKDADDEPNRHTTQRKWSRTRGLQERVPRVCMYIPLSHFVDRVC